MVNPVVLPHDHIQKVCNVWGSCSKHRAGALKGNAEVPPCHAVGHAETLRGLLQGNILVHDEDENLAASRRERVDRRAKEPGFFTVFDMLPGPSWSLFSSHLCWQGISSAGSSMNSR